ncbi:MAG TPA: hydroxymethylbilane synthase [Burkholderiales bacterium]|nr:hydroxymethylbilane synthase [Burkholderiales bacterium]
MSLTRAPENILSPSPSTTVPAKIVIASRESALALWQARFIHTRLSALYPKLEIRILGMTTQGDTLLDAPLAKIGGKGLFVKELEQALQEGRADIAVHSMKDLPMRLPSGFTLAAITEREDPRDAFVSNRYKSPAELPAGSVVGTSSLRRESQLRACFPHLEVNSLRGNVGTRLKKLDEERYAAIILAAAGLKRLGLESRITALLSPEQSLPAPGQGALGIECLASRRDLLELLRPLNHQQTALCVSAERAMSRALSGSCQVPLGGYAEIQNDEIWLRGFVATPDGRRLIRAEKRGKCGQPEALGESLAQELKAKGAAQILAELESA